MADESEDTKTGKFLVEEGEEIVTLGEFHILAAKMEGLRVVRNGLIDHKEVDELYSLWGLFLDKTAPLIYKKALDTHHAASPWPDSETLSQEILGGIKLGDTKLHKAMSSILEIKRAKSGEIFGTSATEQKKLLSHFKESKMRKWFKKLL